MAYAGTLSAQHSHSRCAEVLSAQGRHQWGADDVALQTSVLILLAADVKASAFSIQHCENPRSWETPKPPSFQKVPKSVTF
eukprot:1086677-Amphidinium_carterae.1